MKEYYISMEKTLKMQKLHEKKQALDDFCLVLAGNKDYIMDNSELLYEKMINDKMTCLKEIDELWEDIKNNDGIIGEEGKRFYLDFSSGRITVK